MSNNKMFLKEEQKKSMLQNMFSSSESLRGHLLVCVCSLCVCVRSRDVVEQNEAPSDDSQVTTRSVSSMMHRLFF